MVADVLERRPPRESAGGVTPLQIIPLFKTDGLLSALAIVHPAYLGDKVEVAGAWPGPAAGAAEVQPACSRTSP